MESYATASQVWAAGLVFARIGALVMTMPGVGEAMVPPRIRLAFALALALLLSPVVAGNLGAVPTSLGTGVAVLIRELLIGLMIGAILRMFMSALAAAGEVVSIQTQLSFAQTVNPIMGAQGSTLATFLNLLGIVLIMTTDLHHMFIGAIAHSYDLFPFGQGAPVGDAAQLAIRTLAQSFTLGIQLSAPVVVFSLVLNVAIGLVARVMPQFQVFFVATPLAVMLGLALFALSLGTIGMIWVGRYRDLLGRFV